MEKHSEQCKPDKLHREFNAYLHEDAISALHAMSKKIESKIDTLEHLPELRISNFSSTYQTLESELKEKYSGKQYKSLDDMPKDLRNFYLALVGIIAEEKGVDPIALMATHFAEKMGHGWQPFPDHVSSAGATGVGQVTPGFWNGWHRDKDGRTSPRNRFLTDPAEIAKYGGSGVDFDGDGKADPNSLADNIAATASTIRVTDLSKPSELGKLRSELCLYNAGKSCQNAPLVTNQYASIGVNWARANRLPILAMIAAAREELELS